jgi:hypothetical protein
VAIRGRQNSGPVFLGKLKSSLASDWLVPGSNRPAQAPYDGIAFEALSLALTHLTCDNDSASDHSEQQVFVDIARLTCTYTDELNTA